jgi:hypothetical protein
MHRLNREFNTSGDIRGSDPLRGHLCFAKSVARRHIILKEGLTPPAPAPDDPCSWRGALCQTPAGNKRLHGIVADDSNPKVFPGPPFVTEFPIPKSGARAWHRNSHAIPMAAAAVIAAGALALVTYLLWPTWSTESAADPHRLPVSVAGTLFNVPPSAIRMKVQRHSGPQERIDLAFIYPSLQPPEAPKHVTAETVEESLPPIERIFLSIAAHHDSLSPDMRVRTIYPRYLVESATAVDDSLSMRAFRNNSPYGNEDLFTAVAPSLSARCTRDAATPGMCLSERRLDGADLTFRFPRSWLSQWRVVAAAMDQLTLQLHGSK